MGWPFREVVSSLEYHSGSGISRVSSGRWFVPGFAVVAAAMSATILTTMVAPGASVISARARMVTGLMVGIVARSVTGIQEIIVGAGVPVGPLRRGVHGLANEVEMMDLGMAQRVNLMFVAEGYKYLLADRDVALFGDHQVEEPAGNAPIVGHALIHKKRNGYLGGGAQVLIAAIQGYGRTLGFGDYLEGTEDALGAEQACQQGQDSDRYKSRFHVFLLGMNDSTVITRPAPNPAE